MVAVLFCICYICICHAVHAAPPNTIEIAPGVFMPYANLGGVTSRPSNYTEWLKLGGRGLDTALTYGDNVQTKVAEALRTTSVPRSEIFLTTKVPCCPSFARWCTPKYPEFNGSIAADVNRDVAILGKVDLILLHWPCDTYEETVKAYKGLETALASGVTRAIGVSNFNATLLKRMLSDPGVSVKPSVNQCGHSVGAHNSSHNPRFGGDDGTVKFCADNGISYSAYSPLGGLSGLDIYKNPRVVAIGKAHNKSPAQVALRWLVQQNITVVTAANKESYEAEDMDLFSFSLTDQEMAALTAL